MTFKAHNAFMAKCATLFYMSVWISRRSTHDPEWLLLGVFSASITFLTDQQLWLDFAAPQQVHGVVEDHVGRRALLHHLGEAKASGAAQVDATLAALIGTNHREESEQKVVQAGRRDFEESIF
jgi:hypothetical protein